MSENLHLVFSKPPEGISDESYNQWYDSHLSEILVVPGFVSARRYRLETIKGGWTPLRPPLPVGLRTGGRAPRGHAKSSTRRSPRAG